MIWLGTSKVGVVSFFQNLLLVCDGFDRTWLGSSGCQGTDICGHHLALTCAGRGDHAGLRAWQPPRTSDCLIYQRKPSEKMDEAFSISCFCLHFFLSAPLSSPWFLEICVKQGIKCWKMISTVFIYTFFLVFMLCLFLFHFYPFRILRAFRWQLDSAKSDSGALRNSSLGYCKVMVLKRCSYQEVTVTQSVRMESFLIERLIYWILHNS